MFDVFTVWLWTDISQLILIPLKGNFLDQHIVWCEIVIKIMICLDSTTILCITYVYTNPEKTVFQTKMNEMKMKFVFDGIKCCYHYTYTYILKQNKKQMIFIIEIYVDALFNICTHLLYSIFMLISFYIYCTRLVEFKCIHTKQEK